jgi:hypothetical protein
VRRRTLLAMVMVVVGLAIAAPSAPRAEAAPATGVVLTAPAPVYDSSPGKVAPGTPVPLPGLDRSYILITASGATEDGAAYMTPCGTSPTGAAAVAWLADESLSNLVRVGAKPSAGWCLVVSTSVGIVINVVGREGDSGGDPYVRLAPRIAFDSTIASGGEQHVAVINVGGVKPLDDTRGVFAFVDLQSPGYVTLYQCGTTKPSLASVSSSLGLVSSAVMVPMTAALPGSTDICVYAFSPAGTPVAVTVRITGYLDHVGAASAAGPTMEVYDVTFTAPPGLRPETPTRLFDTRESTGRTPVAGGSVYRLELARFEPPDATPRSVIMNVTVTEPSGDGFVTVYPCSEPRPTASNLNYVAGQTVPNLVTVGVGTDGAVCFFTKTTTHLVADLAAWYVASGGSGFSPRSPKRLFDTRESARRTPVSGGTEFVYDLSNDVPADADAVTMNVTVTEPGGDGYLTVYPCSAPRPTASNLNYSARQTVPNLVTVRVGADRKVCFYAQRTLHLVADLAGSYEPTAPAGFFDITPARALDTRDPGETKLADGGTTRVLIAEGGSGAILNVTVTDGTGPGYVTAYPCGAELPTASNLNYVAGQTVPNLVSVQLSAAGEVCFFAKRSTHLVVDVAGVFDIHPLVTIDPVLIDT